LEVPGKFKSKHAPSYLRNFLVHLKGKTNGVVSRSFAIKPDLNVLQRSAREVTHRSHLKSEEQAILNNIKIEDSSSSEGACACRNSNSISLPLQFGRGAVASPLRFHEDFSLDNIHDLIQAGYSPSGIVWYVQLFKSACTRCIALGQKLPMQKQSQMHRLSPRSYEKRMCSNMAN
jgi:hypothetical protein